MYRYYTRFFQGDSISLDQDIDNWINGLRREDLLNAEGANVEIVGYVAVGNRIVITLSRWEVRT